MKWRIDHPLWRRLGPLLARGLAHLIFRSNRVKVTGNSEGEALLHSSVPVIFAVWHGQLLAPLYFFRVFCPTRAAVVLMASPSRDGEFIAAVARALGHLTVPGSRHKGGVKALKELAAYVHRGHSAGLAADGSRGPAHVVQKGVLYLARETQAPILPLAVAASRKVTLNTWDRFELPLPWGQIALLLGSPLKIAPGDRGAALEKRRLDLEARLQQLFLESQQFFRHP